MKELWSSVKVAEFNHFKGCGEVTIESQGTRGSELKREGWQEWDALECDSRRASSTTSKEWQWEEVDRIGKRSKYLWRKEYQGAQRPEDYKHYPYGYWNPQELWVMLEWQWTGSLKPLNQESDQGLKDDYFGCMYISWWYKLMTWKSKIGFLR